MGLTRAEYNARVESRVRLMRTVAEGYPPREDGPRLSHDIARLMVLDSEEFRELRKQVKD